MNDSGTRPQNARRAGFLYALVLSCCAAAGALALTNRAEPRASVAWRTPVEIARGPGVQGPWRQNESNYDYVDDPAVALAADGSAHVVWVDQRRKDVLFQSYDRSGKARFVRPVEVSRTPNVFSWLPRIAVSPGNSQTVFVLWQEIVFSGGTHGGEIFFSRALEGGRRFETPLNLSNSVPGDGKGRINRTFWHNGSLDLAVGPDGALFAAWTEYDGPLWFTRSTDDGASFSKPLMIAGGGTSKPARAPALAVAPDNKVYLAWTVGEDDSADIRIVRSTDGGRSFGDPTFVAVTQGYSDAPGIAVDGSGVVHVAYAESVGGPFDRCHIRYTRSRDGGHTFEAAREISTPALPNARSAAFPALAIGANDTVYVSWEIYPHALERPRGLALVHSVDGGTRFTSPVRVPGSVDPAGGFNGSLQGLLMRKLAVNEAGEVAIVNSSFRRGVQSRVWLVRGTLQAPTRHRAGERIR